jgi:putative ABC transport system permease protein
VNRFALRNLVRNRVRSLLALLGLAGSTAGVVILVALSVGARKMAREIADKTPGIFVNQTEALPHFSRVPLSLEEKLRAVDGVAAVDPEIWHFAFQVEHKASFMEAAAMPTIVGVDPVKHARLLQGGAYARNLVKGRMFRADERTGTLLSTRFAHHYKKDVGDSIDVIGQALTVTGIFETRSPLFDGVILAHESLVRDLVDLNPKYVRCFFIEVAPGRDFEEVRKRIGRILPAGLESGTTMDWSEGGMDFVSGMDGFLAAIALVAGTLGALGVVNTMLMSVRERIHELGVLRATGWTRGDVFRLIVSESALLGAAGGLLGNLLGIATAALAGTVMPLTPTVPLVLVLSSFAGSVLLGALGGLYPAIAAARLSPMGAIRT